MNKITIKLETENTGWSKEVEFENDHQPLDVTAFRSYVGVVAYELETAFFGESAAYTPSSHENIKQAEEKMRKPVV